MPAPTIVYDVFKNDGNGGPVDYTTVVATVTSPTYTPASLAAPSDTTFAIRARDSANAVSERNVDAVRRIVIDASGRDVTRRPNRPSLLSASPGPNGSASVSWRYEPAGQGGPPTGFKIYATPHSVGSPAWTTPAASLPYRPDVVDYVAMIAGLTDGVTYWIGVRAYNAAASDPNTTTVDVVADATPPTSIQALSVLVID